jgi:hypothetical protein
MYAESTIGAPVMIAGLAIGFFLCFYGSGAQKVLLPVRSVFSGALISLSIALLAANGSAVLATFSREKPYEALGALLWPVDRYELPVIYLLSSAIGGLLLFFLSRRHRHRIGFAVKILTGLSMGLAIFLLLRSFLGLEISLLFSSVILFFILFLCLKGFDYYFATESALAGGLLVSYLVTRFWYLSTWLFFLWTVLLTILGIFAQVHRIHDPKKKETRDA